MKKDFSKQKAQLKSLVNLHFIPVLENKLDEQISFIKDVQELHKRFENSRFDQHERSECVTTVMEYKKDLILLIEKHFAIQQPASFDTQFPAFGEAIDTYLKILEDRIVRVQVQERFISQPGDNTFIMAGKGVKRVFIPISKIPARILNLFRKQLKKEQKPLKSWTHNVDYKNLSGFYLKALLSKRLVKLLTGINQKKCAASLLSWKADEEIVAMVETFLNSSEPFVIDKSVVEISDNTISDLTAEKERIRKEIDNIFEQTFAEFVSAFYKAGTFELSNKRVNRTAIKKKERDLQEETIDIEKGWMGTWQVLRDDWQIDNELYHLLLSVFGISFISLTTFRSKLESNIVPGLNDLRGYLANSKNRIEQERDISGQKKIIAEEKEAFFSGLVTRLIPAVNEQILSQEFPSQINLIEGHANKLIRQISTKRSVIRTPDFTAPIRSSLISFISPYELITFESWPQLFKVIKQVKVQVVERIGNIQNSIVELGQIASFSLESALEFNADDSSASSPGEIASEGLDRSLERLDEIEKSLLSLDKLWEEDLFQGLHSFSDSLIKLTDNNNIIDIRVRIAKGKALKRGGLFYKQFTQKARSLLPVITQRLINLYRESHQHIKGTFKKYGISSRPDSITTEMADFLAETQQSIQKLPFVYQRLFKIEPLNDTNFFIGRTQELQALQLAYNNWLKGRFAATIIVGEIGSGVSSLLNIFLKSSSDTFPVLRLRSGSCISSKDELYHFLNDQFKQNITRIDEWADYLNAQEKKVVIIEDIQRLYLKKVNGFNALKELNELISLTSKTILWVITCTEYAFNYLDKAILFSDQFSYLIKLEVFEDNTMVDIIKRRHAVSGYNIRYEPAPSDLSNKKYRKLTDDEKQSTLQREYFSDLNKHVKSNISLGLIYWLRSVSEVSGNTIVIRSMKHLNLSFLNSLSATKLFALCVLILHERLNEENLGIVLNIKTVEARRLVQPLCEDGILVSKEGDFSVNPLLYIKTISLLKNKNIIH